MTPKIRLTINFNWVLTICLASVVQEVFSSDNEWNSEGVFVESFSDAVSVVNEGPAMNHQLALVLIEAGAALVKNISKFRVTAQPP